MKKILYNIFLISLLLAFAIPMFAQVPPATNAVPPTASLSTTNPPTIEGAIQGVVDAVKANETNWYFGVYGLYAPGLQKHAGGGAAALYPLSDYVVTGLRLDYVNGGFWMPSGNATLQVPIKLADWLTVTPFTYAGIGVPVSGATVSGVTLAGQMPKDNDGQPTAILGYGGSVTLWSNSSTNSKPYIPRSLYLVGDRESWSGFTGYQYRVGIFANFHF